MTATVYYEPNKVPAGILALLVHSVFFVLLYFGFNWNRQLYAPPTMTVTLWSNLPVEAVAPPPPPSPRVKEIVQPPPPPPTPQVKVAKPEIAIPEKKKTIPKPVEVKPEVTKPVVTKPVEKKLEKREQEQRVLEEAKIKAEAQRVAERMQEDRRLADEQAAQQRAELVKQQAQAAAVGKVIDEYKLKIHDKIQRNVVMPPNVPAEATAEFLVTLLPGGAVLKVELRKSSGNIAYDNAVERAILKSDPLPLPPDVQMFNRFRELDLIFKPE